MTFVIKGKALDKLIEYLNFHEEDIAIGVNDFYDLRELFMDVIGRPAVYLDDRKMVSKQ